MIKFTVPKQVRCGETTCASAPGEFCPQMRTDWHGSPYCFLFRDENNKETRLKTSDHDGMGWTLRCPQCLEAEKETMK